MLTSTLRVLYVNLFYYIPMCSVTYVCIVLQSNVFVTDVLCFRVIYISCYRLMYNDTYQCVVLQIYVVLSMCVVSHI